MKNKKAEFDEFENLIKIILWIIFFLVAATALFFIIRGLGA